MRNRKLKNMFYVGQYTHPGIGVPMTLISAEIASALIADEFSHGLALPLENRSLADRS
jgi:phytoene desaturase